MSPDPPPPLNAYRPERCYTCRRPLVGRDSVQRAASRLQPNPFTMSAGVMNCDECLEAEAILDELDDGGEEAGISAP